MLEAVLRPPESLLRASWGPLGASWAPLAGVLEACWGSVAVLERYWDLFGRRGRSEDRKAENAKTMQTL